MLLCVIFCKHKTACEMRISDWSSDGCSSDLRRTMATLEKVRVREYMSSRLMTFTPEMEVMNAVHQLVKSGHSGAPVVDASGKLVGMLSERDCLQIAMVAAQDTCVAGPISQYMRSEEHTSELQSLMRISYAVFCLKKKTKHTTNATHTH